MGLFNLFKKQKPTIELSPIELDPHEGFVYPSMRETVKPYFEDVFKKNFKYGWINVYCDGIAKLDWSSMQQPVLQIINTPIENQAITSNIGIYFYPYMMEDENLLVRFMNNVFREDFGSPNLEQLHSDAPQYALYGTDIERAIKVSSYILATVYGIPTDVQLRFVCDTPAKEMF